MATTFIVSEFKDSTSYKSVIGASLDQLKQHRPYSAAAITFHRRYKHAGQVKFFEDELRLIDERIAELDKKSK